jgi:tRNA nucleotidyltransferase (CCA-adding enzyme)
VLGFTIKRESSQSIFKNSGLLENIAKERIQNEFSKLLNGKNTEAVLRDYREVIERFIPEINAMAGFNQHNNHHIYDVWEHTLKSVVSIEPDCILRMTMLLHDIGKPYCYMQDENGVGHFYGHGEKSTDMAGTILRRLKYDRNTIDTVTELVRLHDSPISPDENSIKHRLNQLGENTLRLLLKVKAADVAAQNPIYSDRLNEIDKMEEILDDIIARGRCFSVKDLQVNGVDLLALGIPEGPEIGTILSKLLNAVIENQLPNEHGVLMSQVQFMKDKINE